MRALAALALAALASAPAPEVPAPSASRTPIEGGWRVDARTGGRIVDVAFPREHDGRRAIVALVAPLAPGEREGERRCDVRPAGSRPETAVPARLLRLDTAGDGDWVTLANDLDAETTRLAAFDLDGDGQDELIEGRAGRLAVRAGGWSGSGSGERRALIEAEGARFHGLLGAPRPPAVARRFHVPLVGRLLTFGPAGGEARWTRLAETPMRVEAGGGAHRIVLRNRPVVVVGPSRHGGDVLLSDQEQIGPGRVRVTRIEPEAPEEERSVECWAKLPAPERVVDADYVLFDGEPALVATTIAADKLSFFGEKKLRVWRLGPDRTRTGLAPILAAETGANVWQQVAARAFDADGDGRDDLVLAYWKGLKDSVIAFEVRGRAADGSWAKSPRRFEMNVPDGDRAVLGFGDDLDGDRRPDLVLATASGLRIHRGAPHAEGARLVEREPAAVLPFPEGATAGPSTWVGIGPDGISSGTTGSGRGFPQPVDLDGDGRSEIVVVGNDATGGRVLVYGWSPR